MTARILLSNDDGIHAEGLVLLAGALASIADIVVVAPERNQSGASHSLTLRQPLGVRRLKPGWFCVDGTPTDCVNLGLLRLFDRSPDLVISGINAGFNVGEDVIYSGTVAAAREASLLGRPAVAVSLDRSAGDSWHAAVEFTTGIARRILRGGLPEDTLLNVNVPAGHIRGVRVTRQGRRLNTIITPSSAVTEDAGTYWIGEASSAWKEDPQSDYAAVSEGFISVTPLQSDLTDHQALDRVERWILRSE